MSKTGKRLPVTAARTRAGVLIPMALAIACATPSGAAPPPAQISLYCGGGATGDGGGLIVQANGVILHTGRERPGEPNVLKQSTVPQEQVLKWHAMLDAAGFDSLPRGEPSNVTCSLARRSFGGEHVILWGGERQPPEALRGVVDEIWGWRQR